MRSRAHISRGLRRSLLVLTLATGLIVAGFAATGAVASSGGASIYSDKNSCLAASGSSQSGSVTFNRTDKYLDIDMAMSSAGSYGVAVFTLSSGGCHSQFLGRTASDGTGHFSVKIQGAGHSVTVVLCVNVSGTPNFSDPVTLP